MLNSSKWLPTFWHVLFWLVTSFGKISHCTIALSSKRICSLFAKNISKFSCVGKLVSVPMYVCISSCCIDLLTWVTLDFLTRLIRQALLVSTAKFASLFLQVFLLTYSIFHELMLLMSQLYHYINTFTKQT